MYAALARKSIVNKKNDETNERMPITAGNIQTKKTILWFCFEDIAKLNEPRRKQMPALQSAICCKKNREQRAFERCVMHDEEMLSTNKRKALQEKTVAEEHDVRQMPGFDWKGKNKWWKKL